MTTGEPLSFYGMPTTNNSWGSNNIFIGADRFDHSTTYNSGYSKIFDSPPPSIEIGDGVKVGENFMRYIKDALGYGTAVVKCKHCGQWAAIKTACVHCGAPVDPEEV